MASTSPSSLAAALAADCLERNTYDPSQLHSLVRLCLTPASEAEAARELFATIVEPLSDRFEPRLAELYVQLFADVLAQAAGFDSSVVKERYARVQRPEIRKQPRRVVVLSRVTLGADVAVTSVLLDGAKRAYPDATILFAGPAKNWELFSPDPRLAWLDFPYPRHGGLRERLHAPAAMQELADDPETLILDPDSRLSQLGLLPWGDGSNYLLFPSRSYGAETAEPLAVLAQHWTEQVLGMVHPQPYTALPPCAWTEQPRIAVSLGVGGNWSKRFPDPFERDLMTHLSGLGAEVLIDLGGSEEEKSRVLAATEGLPVALHEGAFARFAQHILASDLYVGYDSSGQHVAAAAGVPLVTFFAGAVNERFRQRWTPWGPGPRAIVTPDQDDWRDRLSAMLAPTALP